MSKCFFVYKNNPRMVSPYSGGEEFYKPAKIVENAWAKFIDTKCPGVYKLDDHSMEIDVQLRSYTGRVMPAFRGSPGIRMVILSDEGFTAFLLEYT